MNNVIVIVAVGILSFLVDHSLALQIGAFNTGVYGQTKSSKSEVVSIFVEVFIWVFEFIMLSPRLAMMCRMYRDVNILLANLRANRLFIRDCNYPRV